jgi:hypothetical protein
VALWFSTFNVLFEYPRNREYYTLEKLGVLLGKKNQHRANSQRCREDSTTSSGAPLHTGREG